LPCPRRFSKADLVIQAFFCLGKVGLLLPEFVGLASKLGVSRSELLLKAAALRLQQRSRDRLRQ
jgi:hypothetical protein